MLTGPSRMLLLSGCALKPPAAAAACSMLGCSCDLRTRARLSDRSAKGRGSVGAGFCTFGTPSWPELVSTRELQQQHQERKRSWVSITLLCLKAELLQCLGVSFTTKPAVQQSYSSMCILLG